MVIKPEERLTSEEKAFEVEMSVSGGGSTVYKTNSDFSTWTQVDNVKMDNGVARFAAQEGGVYVAVAHSKAGMIAGIVVGVLVLVGVLVGASVLYVRKQPGKANAFFRSCQGKV